MREQNTLFLDYQTSGDYTFDSDTVEFGDEVKLKSNYSSNVLIAASFSAAKTFDYSRDGGLTAVESESGAVAIASGKLALTGATPKKIVWSGNRNTPGLGAGCIRFRYTPGYTGSPATIQDIFAMHDGPSSTRNGLNIQHLTNGTLTYTIRRWGTNTTGTADHASWAPTSGTEYEIELNWNMATNTYAFYIDGTRVGQGGTGAYTPLGYDGNHGHIRIGNDINDTSSTNGIFSIRDLLIFDTTQNTGATRTTGYTMPTTKYTTTHKSVLLTTGVDMYSVKTFDADFLVAGSDTLKFYLELDGSNYYFVGSTLTALTDITTQGNTLAELSSNVANITNNVEVSLGAILKSADGSTTPKLYSASIGYLEPSSESPIGTCTVFGKLKDASDNPVEGAIIKFSVSGDETKYVEAQGAIIFPTPLQTTTDEDGYFEQPLIKSSQYEGKNKYKLYISKGSEKISTSNRKEIEFDVPNAESLNISDKINGKL